MTSRSPDRQSHASAEPAAPGSGWGRTADQLEALRSAISEIDRRHAEGESLFLTGPAATSADADDRPAAEQDPDALEDRAADDDRDEDDDELDDSDEDDDELDDSDFDAAYAKAKKTAMNMLAMRDHSCAELREKLGKREIPAPVIDELVEKLEKSRLLDDAEFAQRYVRAHRERRKLSRSALKRELTKKGISADIIAGVVDDVDGEEELARQVAEKKAASSRGLDYEVRQRRILGMLARRGFSSTVCLKVTREVLADD